MFNPKIILVEDSMVSRQMILMVLNDNGFTNVDTPETSVEAWEMITNSVVDGDPYQLILTDLNMPDLDGMDLIMKIKEDLLSEEIAIVVISADYEDEVIDKAIKAGAKAYFTKPLDEELFVNKIKELFT